MLQRFVANCDERNGQINNLRALCAEAARDAADSLLEVADGLACRLAGVQRAARQRLARAEKLVQAWKQLNSATQQAEQWLNGPRIAQLIKEDISPESMEAQHADIKVFYFLNTLILDMNIIYFILEKIQNYLFFTH